MSRNLNLLEKRSPLQIQQKYIRTMAEGILLDNGAVGVIFKKLTGLPSAE